MVRFTFIFYYVLLALIFSSCYGVNKKTSEIGDLNTDCLDSNAWDNLILKHSVTNITDTLFIESLESLKNRTFKTDILFFEDYPKELIAVAEDHYSIRYVFNPKISSQVLDGLSSKLNESEKKRIRNRVQKLLMEYQCSKGKQESLYLMKE